MALSQKPFELGVLEFELAQSLSLRELHATKLEVLLEKLRVAKAAVAVEPLYCHSGIGIVEETNDQFLSESDPFYIHHFPSG